MRPHALVLLTALSLIAASCRCGEETSESALGAGDPGGGDPDPNGCEGDHTDVEGGLEVTHTEVGATRLDAELMVAPMCGQALVSEGLVACNDHCQSHSAIPACNCISVYVGYATPVSDIVYGPKACRKTETAWECTVTCSVPAFRCGCACSHSLPEYAGTEVVHTHFISVLGVELFPPYRVPGTEEADGVDVE